MQGVIYANTPPGQGGDAYEKSLQTLEFTDFFDWSE